MADSLGGVPLPPGGQTPRRPGASPPAAQPVAGPAGPAAGAGPDGDGEASGPAPPADPSAPAAPADGFVLTGKAPGQTSGKPGTTAGTGPATGPAPPPGDTFVPFTGPVRLGQSQVPAQGPGGVPGQPSGLAGQGGGIPGQPSGLAGQGGGIPGNGTDAAGLFSEAETGRYDAPEQFPPEIAEAFEALANAPFGVKTPVKAAGSPAALQALFRQYQVIPHEVLKKAPAAFLFLNTLVGKYPPSEIRRLAEMHGVDLQRVMTALVLDPPARPTTVARLASEHQLGAERSSLLKQADLLAASPDPLNQVAGKFTRTVLANNPQALQAMLTDPLTFFSAQLWNKLGRDQQAFMADGRKTRQATGLLQRGGLSAKGLAWVVGENRDESRQDGQGGHDGQGGAYPGQAPGAHELHQQKAFYDNWRESLIKGIKDASDAKAGRMPGPPVIDLLPIADPGSGRAAYDPARKAVRLGAAHAHPESLRVHTSGLTLTVAPDGEIVEIALRNPHDRWEVKKDLGAPVIAGLEAGRARIAGAREGAAYPTHDRFYTSLDRNVIYLQVEKKPIARRALAAANVLLELDEDNHLLGIVIWQLAASRPAAPGDQKAWIAGLADRGPPAGRRDILGERP